MKKDFDNICNQLQKLYNEIIELKKLVNKQNDEIEGLKKQLDAVSTVKIEEDGKQSVESFGNLILDEIVSIKKKLESIGVSKLADSKDNNNANENSEGNFSLSELKDELIKLADMMAG